MVHPLKLSLEDLYKGKTMRLAITRNIIVAKTNPTVPVDEDEVTSTWTSCEECNGQGAVIRMRQIGPGRVQQMQVACQSCGGAGNSLKPGFKMVKKREVLEVRYAAARGGFAAVRRV